MSHAVLCISPLFSISLSARATPFLTNKCIALLVLYYPEKDDSKLNRLCPSTLWRLWQMVVVVARRPSASWLLSPGGLQMSAQPGLGVRHFSQRLKAAPRTLPLGWKIPCTYRTTSTTDFFASYRTASFGVCYAKFPSFPMGLNRLIQAGSRFQ